MGTGEHRFGEHRNRGTKVPGNIGSGNIGRGLLGYMGTGKNRYRGTQITFKLFHFSRHRVPYNQDDEKGGMGSRLV